MDTGALVTGAATRIGRELALALARRGFSVAVHFNESRECAHSVVEEAGRFGVQASAIKADLSCGAEAMRLVGKAADALGVPLGILVNNASRFERDRIGSSTQDEARAHLCVNLEAPLLLTQEFAKQAPEPSEDDCGEPVAAAAVVNLLDQRVMRPTSEFGTYTISKIACWGLTQTSALALAPKVRVNAIGPGPTLMSKRQSADHFRRQRGATPLRRSADLADIAAALNFILDAKSMTGQMICLDGGQFLSWSSAVLAR